SPEKGSSVPFRLVTSYCSGVNSCRHSASVFFTFSLITHLPEGHMTSRHYFITLLGPFQAPAVPIARNDAASLSVHLLDLKIRFNSGSLGNHPEHRAVFVQRKLNGLPASNF